MDGIAWASSAMVAARTRLEIATENLANVSSVGFRPVSARGFLTSLGVAIARERQPPVSAAAPGGAVDAIHEMVNVLAAERSFESAEKTVTAIDTTRQKAAEAGRIN